MFDAPYVLNDQAERLRRTEMLTQPHMNPLADYLLSVRASCKQGTQTPQFDPCDSGIYARALFLLEAPGPQAVKTGFVSRNNPDPTARNLWHLMDDAHLSRSDTLIWNTVPWYVGEKGSIRPVTNADIQEAFPYLRQLIDLLSCLKVIVLVGRKAQSATPLIRTAAILPIVPTYHPSGRVFNIWPEKERQTQEAFTAVGQMLQDNKRPHHA